MQILKFIALLGAVAVYVIFLTGAIAAPTVPLMTKLIAIFALGLVVTVAVLGLFTLGSRRS